MKDALRGLLNRIKILDPLRTYLWHKRSEVAFRRKVRAHEGELNVIIGAMFSTYPGWVSTNMEELNMANPRHWTPKYWQGKRVDRFLLEHCLEHITYEQARVFLKQCFALLKPGGTMRIAVPDANNPNEGYQALTALPHKKKSGVDYSQYKWIDPSSPYAGDKVHLYHYNVAELSQLIAEAGLVAEPLEYYTPTGELQTTYADSDRGVIYRSAAKGFRSYDLEGYNSLIVDAVKPANQ